jgi:hypothetical protein
MTLEFGIPEPVEEYLGTKQGNEWMDGLEGLFPLFDKWEGTPKVPQQIAKFRWQLEHPEQGTLEIHTLTVSCPMRRCEHSFHVDYVVERGTGQINLFNSDISIIKVYDTGVEFCGHEEGGFDFSFKLDKKGQFVTSREIC